MSALIMKSDKNYILKEYGLEELKHGILCVSVLVKTPKWVGESYQRGDLYPKFQERFKLKAYIYPKLQSVYRDNLKPLLNIIIHYGLRPYCDRAFCCCDYDEIDPQFDERMAVYPREKLETWHGQTDLELDIYDDFFQFEYVKQLKALALKTNSSFDDLVRENGLNLWEKYQNSNFPINSNGTSYFVKFNYETRNYEIQNWNDFLLKQCPFQWLEPNQEELDKRKYINSVFKISSE